MPTPFIAIEGTDGSGKRTQSKLLAERLEREGRKVCLMSFPHYGKPEAFFIEELLRHRTYGNPDDLSAKRASAVYALERFHCGYEIRRLLDAGTVVIADRYTGSNKGHQMSKIQDAAERKAFLDWLNEYEYGLLGIPKPNATVLLHVPAEISFQLQGREQHEASLPHLQATEAAYLELVQMDTVEHWSKLTCTEDGKLLPIEAIHERLWVLLQPHLG